MHKKSISEQILQFLTNLRREVTGKNRRQKKKRITEAAALVVIVRSTATGARVGSTAEVCIRQGSRSIVPPPFCKAALIKTQATRSEQHQRIYNYNVVNFKHKEF